ncbi:MAG TPA: ImmA/IrrE family metallo-endopeptidase [Candidatus Faecousia intestinavium]|nr:ImmA/IrrE family metallo-endopeptidase [Candidatus Faecousia intestinavium]
MHTQALYDLARQQNIEVLTHPLPQTGSLSVMLEGGRCFVGLDRSVCDGATQERVHLSHELGHCVTGSFYNIYAAVECRQRHENRADKWAISTLIPVEDLDEAVAQGCTEIWELAERFQVTEEFMRKTVCYYVHGNLAAELYF